MTRIFSLLLLSSLFLFLYSCSNPKSVTFQDLNLETLEGEKVDLRGYEGKKIFLNFWATWCGPCRAELPTMAQAQQALGDEYVFLLVSDEPVETLKKFKAQTRMPFVFLHKPTSIKMIGIFSIPQTYLINTKGEVVHDLSGAYDWVAASNMALLKGLD